MKKTNALLLGSLLVSLASNALMNPTALGAENDCPLVAAPAGIKLEIADIQFVTTLVGDNGTMRLPADKADKFRLALVTLRLKKPVGSSLTIAAADLTLHYTHGDGVEVAPCEGISSFNQSLASDRSVTFFASPGPGWVKKTTGVRATQSGEVYLDAVFNLVEPTIRDVWVCVAQPVTPVFASRGWPTNNTGLTMNSR